MPSQAVFGIQATTDWRRVAVSNFTAIAVMLAAHLVALRVYYVGDKWIHNRSEIVFHGVSSGMPVSLRHRRLVLTNAFVSTVIVAISMPIAMTFGFVGLARSVSDSFVESFALFFAFVYGVGAVGLLAAGVIWFSYLLSVLRDEERLRQAEAD
jgi:hypothetical protein